jgi:acyl-coenzyme A synthetase/AMP-(fatty) acid ligase
MNITDPIRRVAQLSPDAAAVIHFGKVVTYRELNGVVDALAGRMLGMGLRPGDAAAILVSDSYGHLALTLALARIGVAAVISRDVAKGVGGVALKTCFVDAARATEAVGGGALVDDGWWRSPAAADQVAAVPSCPDGKAICVFVSSSGTTGVPKALALSHDMMRTRLFAKWLAIRAPDNARQICTLGLESYYGLYSVLRVLWTGGLVATAIKWGDIHAAIPLYQFNCLVMSPAQLHALLESLPENAGPFPSIDAIEIGGSTLPPRLAGQARARLCANIHVTYGAAEAGIVAGAPVAVLERDPGSVGFIAPGVEVQAVDADHRPLPAGAEGTIRIRSGNCIDSYRGDAEATAKSFKDGWFYPGDVGSVSGNGFLAISGRTGEMINAGGVKVSPQSIEDVVLMNQDVSEAAAFSMTHAATGVQEIWAAIVQKNPVDMDALHSFCVQRLGQRAPRSILLVKALPRNENGKVLRDQLIKLAASASKIAGGKSGRP